MHKKRRKKETSPCFLRFGSWCEIGEITISAIFIFYTIPGVFIDRGLRYRTSRGATRSAIAKTSLDKYARNRVKQNDRQRCCHQPAPPIGAGRVKRGHNIICEGKKIVSFVLCFLARKSVGTPTRDLQFDREIAFCCIGRSASLLGDFAQFWKDTGKMRWQVGRD